MEIDQKVNYFFVFIFILLLNDLILIPLNILAFVHLEFFEMFGNVIVFYPVTVESDIWAQLSPS